MKVKWYKTRRRTGKQVFSCDWSRLTTKKILVSSGIRMNEFYIYLKNRHHWQVIVWKPCQTCTVVEHVGIENSWIQFWSRFKLEVAGWILMSDVVWLLAVTTLCILSIFFNVASINVGFECWWTSHNLFSSTAIIPNKIFSLIRRNSTIADISHSILYVLTISIIFHHGIIS